MARLIRRYRLAILVAVFFAASFSTTVATRSGSAGNSATTTSAPAPTTPLARWLGLSQQAAEDIQEQDPDFAEDLKRIRGDLDQARTRLIELFDDPTSSDERLREQLEKTIDKHNQLERRVADHILAVRRLLSSEQQKRLFGLAAERVRQCRRQGWRGGGGGGRGRGGGNGQGRRWRGGRSD